MPTAPMPGHDVVLDVPALALQGRGEAVADDDRADVVRPVHEPQLGHWHAPQLADAPATLNEMTIAATLDHPVGSRSSRAASVSPWR